MLEVLSHGCRLVQLSWHKQLLPNIVFDGKKNETIGERTPRPLIIEARISVEILAPCAGSNLGTLDSAPTTELVLSSLCQTSSVP